MLTQDMAILESLGAVSSVLGILQFFGVGFDNIVGSKVAAAHSSALNADLDALRGEIEKLSDQLFVAKNQLWVQDLSLDRQQQILNLKDMKARLSPMVEAMGTKVLCSSSIITPDKAKIALVEDPWECFDHIKPATLGMKHIPHGFVPITFEYNGSLFIGAQKPGLLKAVFNLSPNFSNQASQIHALPPMPSPPPPRITSAFKTGLGLKSWPR